MNAKLFAVIAYKMDEFSFEYIEICFGISTNIINSCSLIIFLIIYCVYIP